MPRNGSGRFLSPLRYPGGKARLASYVGQLIEAQPQRATRYVEPFTGGGGVALRLLFDEYVDEVVLNDLDAGVAAFWRAMFNQTADLIDLIRSCKPTIDDWHQHHQTYLAKSGNDLELGFATFFLNRTNRSGILGARPIGGLDQKGKWLIDARYDAEELTLRVKRLAEFASRVTVLEEDGIAVAERYLDDDESFLYLDPPYLQKADDLYLDTLRWEDHKRLAKTLLPAGNWFLTYDKDPKVLRLYPGLRCAAFGIAHTAAVQHVGNEYAVFADGLVVPPLGGLGRGDAAFVRRRGEPATQRS